MATVNQAYITNLAGLIEVALREITVSYAIKHNNGIFKFEWEKDIVRLYALLHHLENMSPDSDHFDEDEVLQINAEWKNYCTWKPVHKVSKENVPPDPLPTGLSFERQDIHNVSSSLLYSGGNEQATGYIMYGENPKLKLEVRLNGLELTQGDASKSEHCFWSDDNGVTAKEIKKVDVDDALFLNPVNIGGDILTTDDIIITII